MKIQTSRQFLSRLASRRAARVLQAAVLFTLGSVSAAHASNYYWDPTDTGSTNGSGGGTWNKTLSEFYNGTADVMWTDGNTAIFGNTGGTVTLGVPISALGVELTGTGYTITPSATNTLTLTSITNGTGSALYASGTTNSVGGTVLITGSTTANTSDYITATSGATLNLSGIITQQNTGTSGLTITGPGIVNYSGATLTPGKFNVQGGATFNLSGTMAGFTQTYAGVSDATAGTTWNVLSGGATGNTGVALFVGNGSGTSGAFNVSGTGTAQFGGLTVGGSYVGTIAGDSTGTVTISGTSTLTIGGTTYLGSTKSGVGTLNLNGGTFNAGGVFAQATGNTGSGGSSTIHFNGGTLNFTSGTSSTAAIPSTFTTDVGTGGALIGNTAAAAINQTIASNLTSAAATDGGLTKSGAGIITLSGTNTYNGKTTVSAGVLAPLLEASLPNYATAAKVSVASGATLSLGVGGTGSFTNADVATILTNPTFVSGTAIGLDTTNATGGTYTYSPVISGVIGFGKTGTGTLILSGAETYTGITSVYAGTLDLTNTNNSTGTISIFGGTLLADGTSDGGLASGLISLKGGAFGANSTQTIANNILMTASSSFAGSGALTLNGTFSNSGAANILTASNVGLVNQVGNVYLSEASATARTLTIAGAGPLTISGVIANFNGGAGTASSLTVAGGAGLTFTLSNTNTYSGTTTLTSGTTVLGNKAGFGTSTLSLNGGTLSANTDLSGSNAITNVTGLTGGGVTVSGSNNLEINGATTLSNNATVTNSLSAGTFTLSGSTIGLTTTGSTAIHTLTFAGTGATLVSGMIVNNTGTGGATSGNVTVSGGTVKLSNANTYSGLTTVSGGTLTVANNSALGTSTLTLSGGAIQGDGTARTLGNAIAYTSSSTISGSSDLVFNGAVTNTATGTSALTINNSGTTTFNGAMPLRSDASVGARTLTFAGSGNVVVNSAISNGSSLSGAVIINSTGTVALNGTNSYSSTTTIGTGTSATTVKIGNSSALGFGGASNSTFSGTTIVSAGATLDLNGQTGIVEPFVINGTGVGGNGALINSSTSAAATVVSGLAALSLPTGGGAGYTNGTFPLTFTGGGGTGAAGTVTIAAGVITSIQVTSAGSGYTTTPTVTLTGAGTPTTAASFGGMISSVALNSASSIGGSGDFAINAPVTGGNALTKIGSDTVTLGSVDTYTGATNINAGRLILSGDSTGTTGQLIVNNAGILQFGDGSSTSGSSPASGTIFVNNTGTVQVNKATGGTFTNAIASNPSATITLSGANAAGTINTFTATEFSNGGSLATNSTNAGATVAFTGGSGTLNGDTFTQSIDTKGTNLTVGGAGDTLFSGSIYSSTNGNAVLVAKNGTGNLIYQYNQRYTGETDINAGAVRVDTAQTFGGTYFIGNGGTTATPASLLLGGGTTGLVGGVTFNRTVSVNPGDGTVGNRVIGGTNTSGTNIYSGAVSFVGADNSGQDRSITLTAAGTGTVSFTGGINGGGVGVGQNVTKTGTGTVSFDSNTTYFGTTSVNAGTLLVNASSSGTSSVAVNNNGTLGGSGTLASPTTVNSGGNITGGTVGGVGPLTLTNTVTLTSGSTYLVDIGSGSASDLLAISSTLASTDANIVINSGMLDGTDTYTIATYASDTGSTFTFAGTSGYSLLDTGTALELVPGGAVPEPSTVAGGLLAFGTLAYRTRRQLRGLFKGLRGKAV